MKSKTFEFLSILVDDCESAVKYFVWIRNYITASVVRSEEAVATDVWHELRVSRTAKNGILQVDNQRPVEGMAEVNSFILFENIYSTVQKLVSVRFLNILEYFYTHQGS